jgi:hypothetical protein
MLSWAILFAAAPGGAQQAQDENATLTLHVYTNLMQIPVLVLGPYLDRVPKVDPKKLTVQLGDEKPFHPTHVRPEGDDPVALAIVLDVSDSHNDLLPEFGKALGKLAAKSLHPNDSVAVYALDCGLMRVASFAPADAYLLKSVGELAAKDTTPRTDRKRRSCGSSLPFMDALAVVTDELSRQPGRRVLLAISNGLDAGSKFSDEQVRQFADGRGVAIFGLTEGLGTVPFIVRPGTVSMALHEVPFVGLCESTGGLVRRTSATLLHADLASLVKMVRERIIVEFPRPRNMAAGVYVIRVAVEKSNVFIRPAGISVPIPDSHILADPHTIHPEDSVRMDAVAPSPPQ